MKVKVGKGDETMNRNHFIRSALTLLGAVPLLSGRSDGYATRKEQLIKPAALRTGDTIGLIAPAGIVYDPLEFERMKQVLNAMGLKVRFGRHVRNRYGYLAGRDKERVEDLNDFFEDPSIDGIMAVRGGWGSNRILADVNFSAIRQNPKLFCGFSDITSLHLAILHKCNLVTFHGPNGMSDWTIYTQKNFQSIVFGGVQPPFEFLVPQGDRDVFQVIVPGLAKGPLIGGNLTLVTSLIGTPYMPNLKGAILFLEDIGEEIYRIDRMFSQLALSGILEQLNGLVFGRCTDCKPGNRPSLTLREVLTGYLAPHGIPSFYGARISHEPDNLTIPIGMEAELEADKGIIRLMEQAVLT